MELLFDILKVLFGIIIGGIIGFIVAKNYMKSYFKKNPPINEQMIKIMMQQIRPVHCGELYAVRLLRAV